MPKRTDFVYSVKQEPHRLRTRQILQQHPEVRKLIGKNKYTIFAILGLVAFQVVFAWLVRDSSWWIVVGVAYLLGAFADHSLFVMIHECAHHLLFKAGLPTGFPAFWRIFRRSSPVPFRSSAIISSIIRSRVFMNWMPIFRIAGRQN